MATAAGHSGTLSILNSGGAALLTYGAQPHAALPEWSPMPVEAQARFLALQSEQVAAHWLVLHAGGF